MPYPYYSPSNYMNYSIPQAPQTTAGSIQWVQGESGAKSFPVGANATVLLMDSETQKFYIKTVDASGMPQPLRTFTYEEVKENKPVTDYATKEELDKVLAELENIRKAVTKDEPTV